jgi:hypothetical protein
MQQGLVRRPTLPALARAEVREAQVGTKKRAFRSNKETDEGKDAPPCLNFLTRKAPYKGLGADSVEKHEPVSDIDTVVVNSLKALDPEWPIREADISPARGATIADRFRTIQISL